MEWSSQCSVEASNGREGRRRRKRNHIQGSVVPAKLRKTPEAGQPLPVLPPPRDDSQRAVASLSDGIHSEQRTQVQSTYDQRTRRILLVTRQKKVSSKYRVSGLNRAPVRSRSLPNATPWQGPPHWYALTILP